MMLHYFLTTLKPLEVHERSPMSSDDFCRAARECLTEYAVDDLERLSLMKTLKHDRTGEASAKFVSDLELSPNHNEERSTLYWLWLAGSSRSPFIKRFAHDAMRLYHEIADALSAHTLPSWLSDESLPITIEWKVSDHLLDIVERHRDDDPFSLDAVYAYFIKLMICERHASFSHEKGQAILAALVEGITHERI
jgi:hypothetical protein